MSETTAPSASSPAPTASQPPRIVLGPRLEIRDVEEVHRALLESLNRDGSLRIEVGALIAIDAAGIQLLLAACAEGARRGLSVRLDGESRVLDEAAGLLGVRAALGRGKGA